MVGAGNLRDCSSTGAGYPAYPIAADLPTIRIMSAGHAARGPTIETPAPTIIPDDLTTIHSTGTTAIGHRVCTQHAPTRGSTPRTWQREKIPSCARSDAILWYSHQAGQNGLGGRSP
jgi:hypothetical protein